MMCALMSMIRLLAYITYNSMNRPMTCPYAFMNEMCRPMALAWIPQCPGYVSFKGRTLRKDGKPASEKET